MIKYVIYSVLIHAAILLPAVWFYMTPKKSPQTPQTIYFDLLLEKPDKVTDTISENVDMVTDTITPPVPQNVDMVTVDMVTDTISENVDMVTDTMLENVDMVTDTMSENVDMVTDTISPTVSKFDSLTVLNVDMVTDTISPPVLCSPLYVPYPRRARRRGIEGKVEISVEISEKGEVMSAKVISSSGHKDLDEAGLKAATSVKFSPASKDGIPVKGELILPITFKLK